MAKKPTAAENRAAQAAMAEMSVTASELRAAKALATELGMGFDPATILALIEMIRNLIAGCKKTEEAADPAAAQQACFNCLHNNPATRKQNKRVRAAAKKSLPRAERTDEQVDAVLLAASQAAPASFAALWESVEG